MSKHRYNAMHSDSRLIVNLMDVIAITKLLDGVGLNSSRHESHKGMT